jgi:hypothetical protein
VVVYGVRPAVRRTARWVCGVRPCLGTNDKIANREHAEPVTTTQGDVRTNPSGDVRSTVGEIFAGLVIIIASIYVIAPMYADLPAITAAYGVALAAIARHMWKHDSPRSLPLLCVSFAVTAGALSILGAVT